MQTASQSQSLKKESDEESLTSTERNLREADCNNPYEEDDELDFHIESEILMQDNSFNQFSPELQHYEGDKCDYEIDEIKQEALEMSKDSNNSKDSKIKKIPNLVNRNQSNNIYKRKRELKPKQQKEIKSDEKRVQLGHTKNSLSKSISMKSKLTIG